MSFSGTQPSLSAARTATAAATSAPIGTPTGGTLAPATGATIPLYGVFETQLAIQTQAKNVFDPEQIDVTVQFTAPNGSKINVPAFWMQPYNQTCSQGCAIELLKPAGQGGWRVRFTPSQVGAWTYTVTKREGGSTQTGGQGKFTVTPSKSAGFIRVGKNHRYFGYDNGTPYFTIGSNLGWSWSGANGTLGYQNWLKKLHDVGANYGRLYVNVPWFIGLDWKQPAGDYTGAQEDSWRLDTILQSAEQQDIALQIVIEWAQGFTAYAGPPVNVPTSPGRPDMRADWSSNPFNVVAGGIFSGPTQYFGTDLGRAAFKRLLHYLIARWGYSTSVFAWEMIDQLDRVVSSTPDVGSEWLRQMVAYLRDTDPYKHPITAGVRDAIHANLLDRSVLDFAEVRYYQRRPVEQAPDQVPGALALLAPMVSNASAPILLNEFSLNPWFEPTADDPTGVHVQQTMWAAALSGAAGGAASWWWDTYLFPQNLIHYYGPLASFAKGIPWNTSDLQPIDVKVYADSALAFQAVRVTGFNNTFNGPPGPDVTYRVSPESVSPSISSAPGYLYGVVYNKQLSQPQKYIITPPVDTKLTVAVRKVSDRATAKLVIIIDGKTVAEVTLSPQSAPTSVSVPISAGEHNVVLDNLGDDFLQLDFVQIEQYSTPLRTVALADRTQGIFLSWLQNRDYTWENVQKGVQAKPIAVGIIANAMPPGQYRVELWDTTSGNVVGQEDVTIPGEKAGDLKIDLLPISKDLAVRAIRVAEPGNAPSPTATLTVTPRIAQDTATPTIAPGTPVATSAAQ